MPGPLFSIRAGKETESGLFAAVHPLDAPLWVAGENVIFADGGPQKMPGWTRIASATLPAGEVVRGVETQQTETGIQRIFLGSQSKLYQWQAGAGVVQKGTGFTGSLHETATTPATSWSFSRFGNWVLASNGVNKVQVAKNGADFADLAGTTFTYAAVLMRRGPHILAMNTSSGGNWVHWCDLDNPEIWAPTAENAAGDLTIRDLDGPILAACPLGDQIAILGKNQMGLLTYTGDAFVFTYQPVLSGIGAVSKNAVVEANRRIYGMGREGFWACDGVTYQYLDTPAIKDYLAGRVDTSQLSKVTATYDSSRDMVVWWLPTVIGQENTFGVGYRIKNGSWTLLNFGRSAAAPQVGAFAYPVTAEVAGGIVLHNNGVDSHVSPMTAWVRTKPLDCDDPSIQKYLSQVSIQLRRQVGTVKLRIGTQRNLDDAVTWGNYIALDDGFEAIWVRRSGRFITLEILSDTIGADWAVSGFDLIGDIGGRAV